MRRPTYSILDDAKSDSGVMAGDILLAYTNAVLQHDDAAIGPTREALQEALGQAAANDTAAVIANFQRMVRIADSTGIPLDEPVLMMTQDIRENLGINQYNAAANSPKLGLPKRIMGRLLRPLAPKLMKRIAARRGLTDQT